MVAVQYALGTLQVHIVFRIFTPWQIHQRLQVVQLHIIVGRILIQLIQFVCFLIEKFLDIFGPFLHTGLFQQVLLLRCTLVTHLSLQVLDLLLQEIVSLLLVNVVTCLVADVEL